MGTVIIHECETWRVESHGNGWAYTLTHIPDGEGVFLQDDSAAEFRSVFNNIDSGAGLHRLCREYFA